MSALFDPIGPLSCDQILTILTRVLLGHRLFVCVHVLGGGGQGGDIHVMLIHDTYHE